MGEFNSQELANTVWALAKLERRHDVLMTVVASTATVMLKEFNSQDLASTIWAFAKVEVRHEDGQTVVSLRIGARRSGDVALAGRGAGATVNDSPIRVSETASLGEALFLTGFGYDRRSRPDFYLERVRRALVAGQGLRRCGAATHDFWHIASGRADVYWEFGLSPWDVAAGMLLVREAGGRVTDLDGNDVDIGHPEILACTPRLHAAALQLLGPGPR